MDGSMKKIWGYDRVNDEWIEIAVDDNGYLKIVDSGDLLEAGDLNLDVSNNLGISIKKGFVENIYYEHVQELNASAGADELKTTAIGSGKIVRITNISAYNYNNGAGHIRFYLSRSFPNVNMPLYQSGTIAANTFYSLVCDLILVSPWYIKAKFSSCTLNDNIYLDVVGHYIQE